MKGLISQVILLEKEDMVFVLEWLLQMVGRSLIKEEHRDAKIFQLNSSLIIK